MRENVICALAAFSVGLSACGGGRVEKTNKANVSLPKTATYRSYHTDSLPAKTTEVEELIPRIQGRINLALSYLESCPDENMMWAADKFRDLNAQSKIAFYNQVDMGGQPVGFIIVSDNKTKKPEIAIDPYSILDDSVPIEEIARYIFQSIVVANAYEQGLSPEKAAQINNNSPITQDESFCTK